MLNRLNESKKYIESKISKTPNVAVTLGSGLSDFVNKLSNTITIPFSDIPNFSKTTVEGHPGQMVFGEIGGQYVCVLQGRVHYYEGHDLSEVVFATRLVAQLGAKTLILTNSSGGFLDGMKPGDFMIITDHINLTGQNPLIGKNIPELGARFPDMSEVYNKNLIDKLESVFKNKNVRYHKGIYCGVTGPSYETPAEIRFMKLIGGGAVGMSTVPEAIAANHMGLNLCGLSCITNLASGISKHALTHEEVKEEAASAAKNFNEILHDFIKNL